MTASRKTAGRIARDRKTAGVALVVAAAALTLTTELPQRLSAAVGGSTALAELAARSPGARVGGVALKAKGPSASLAPLSGAAAPAEPGLGNPMAAVQGASGVPEGPLPTSTGPGDFSGDFAAPGIPADVAGPGAPAATDFGTTSFPGAAGSPIFAGGSGGGIGGGGGGSGGTIPGGETPGGGTLLPPVPPLPGVGPVPEPATWFLLISGFAVIGSAMRRSKRVRFA